MLARKDGCWALSSLPCNISLFWFSSFAAKFPANSSLTVVQVWRANRVLRWWLRHPPRMFLPRLHGWVCTASTELLRKRCNLCRRRRPPGAPTPPEMVHVGCQHRDHGAVCKQHTRFLSLIYYCGTNRLKMIEKGFSEENTAGFHLAENIRRAPSSFIQECKWTELQLLGRMVPTKTLKSS